MSCFFSHKWKIIIKERCTLSRSIFGHFLGEVLGLAVLEICTRCGKLRAYYMDSSGRKIEKVPEIAFSEIEIRNAIVEATPKEVH